MLRSVTLPVRLLQVAFTIPNGTDQAAPGARELTARAGLAQARLGGPPRLFGVPPSWQSQPEPPNAAAGSGSSGIRTLQVAGQLTGRPALLLGRSPGLGP